ncbi:hypothetical protein C5167_033715 [Papaver somniferum]|uniref:Uncharacterized protein n=1 Tax=Papaver somniferum TaxID=3469 RepID=A0A4Y7KF50_PAPSO|nr:hypothetical protein C5167_033715 [Papaver somniferum]
MRFLRRAQPGSRTLIHSICTLIWPLSQSEVSRLPDHQTATIPEKLCNRERVLNDSTRRKSDTCWCSRL